jgi:2-polyprenyl-6-methoxyphenol hydroxylase-like FAD-dependent oxidoreductase
MEAVVIVGAGLAGLAAALGLHRYGIHTHVASSLALPQK